MRHVKIALLGAGSRSFGPSTIRDVLLSDPLAECDTELVLMDTVAGHLTDVEAYARHVKGKLGRNTAISSTIDLAAARRIPFAYQSPSIWGSTRSPSGLSSR